MFHFPHVTYGRTHISAVHIGGSMYITPFVTSQKEHVLFPVCAFWHLPTTFQSTAFLTDSTFTHRVVAFHSNAFTCTLLILNTFTHNQAAICHILCVSSCTSLIHESTKKWI